MLTENRTSRTTIQVLSSQIHNIDLKISDPEQSQEQQGSRDTRLSVSDGDRESNVSQPRLFDGDPDTEREEKYVTKENRMT
jgi:hypothetical protein